MLHAITLQALSGTCSLWGLFRVAHKLLTFGGNVERRASVRIPSCHIAASLKEPFHTKKTALPHSVKQSLAVCIQRVF